MPKTSKLDDRGENDLERVIEEQDKEIDTLKTQIDLKELEIEMLKKKHEL